MSFSEIQGFDTVLRLPPATIIKKMIDAEDPNQAVKNIRNIVLQVLDHASDYPMEISKAKEFLSKIEDVNQMIIDTQGRSPFKTAVRLLHETFDKAGPKPAPQELPPKPSSSIQKLKQAFEKPPTESPVKPPSTESTPKKKVIIGTPITFAAIKEDINRLDLSSDGLSAKIEIIKKDLVKLKATGGISAEQSQVLSDALDSLKHESNSFKPSLCETLFIDHCAAKNPALQKAKDEKLPNIVKSEQQYGRSEMLKAIKKSLEAPDSLIASISKRKKELAVELPQKRFHAFEINSPPFNPNFEKNLPQVLQAFETFSKKAMKLGLQQKWEAYLAKLEDTIGSDFVKALQKHPSCNPAAKYDELLRMMQKEYLELFDLRKINESTTIKTYLDTIKEPAKNQALSFFDDIYKANFQKETVWLVLNYTHVEKAYDQSQESNTNLGSGVCFSNCLDRTKKLLINPALPSEKIEMGSTEASRVAHNLYKREVTAKKERGTLTQEDMEKIEKDTAKRLGLTWTKTLSAPYDEADPTKNLGTILQQAYRESGEKASPILSLHAPGRGHAINIQMDKTAKQFRFLDDNFGISGKYSSFDNFKDAFIGYIKANYSEHNQFSLLFYQVN